MSSGLTVLVLGTVAIIVVVSPASVIDAVVSLGAGLFVSLLAIKVMGA
jgi:hypothetical protein